MKFSEILKVNSELGKKKLGKKFSVAVLSNIITSQLGPVIEYTLRQNGLFGKCMHGDYDNIVQDCQKYSDKDLVLIVWEASNFVDGFQYKADLLSENEIDNLIQRVKTEIDFVFEALQNTSSIVITRFSSMVFNHNFILKNKFDYVCDILNQYLEKKATQNCLLLDIDKIFVKLSIEKSVDFRNFYSSKSLYTSDFFIELSRFIYPYVASVTGKTKKALIFDCDNTLWSGVVGEDGLEGIKMSSKDPKGVVFEEVQCLAKYLSYKGIIIGLNSKNNQVDVMDVFTKHKDISLSINQILIKKINWNDKVSNLKEISNELNIGIDSLVFVDDSDFEINLVQQLLPMVKTVQVPAETYKFPELLRKQMQLFFSNIISLEDSSRLQMYKEQEVRDNEKQSFENINDYIRSLDLALKIFKDPINLVPRIAQLTQKTNQFNLTTKRYTENDISHFVNSKTHHVFVFSLTDKYGDYGITGEAIIEIKDKIAFIDTFLMSCRVIGRNVEKRFFQELIPYLKEKGIEKIKASFLSTPKNHQVKNFYDEIGFQIESTNGDDTNYVILIDDFKSININYIKVTYEG